MVNKKGLNELIRLDKTPEWLSSARARLKSKMYARSTVASKDSKRRKVEEIMECCQIKFGVNGIGADELLTVAAVLGEANSKSADQYLGELKLMQLEIGSSWSDVLERQLVMIKRALKRHRARSTCQRNKPRNVTGRTLGDKAPKCWAHRDEQFGPTDGP